MTAREKVPGPDPERSRPGILAWLRAGEKSMYWNHIALFDVLSVGRSLRIGKDLPGTQAPG